MQPVSPWEYQPAFLPLASMARNSRLPKMLPHLHFAADYSIWHDGSYALRKKPSWLIDRYLGGLDMAMFRHPCRTTVEQEAAILVNEKISDPGDVARQVERWKSIGSPSGLWAGGMILRKHTPQIERLNEAWWHEFSIGTARDQMALPIARDLTKTPICTIDGNVFENDLLAWHWHTAWKDKGDNMLLEAQRAAYVERRRRLEEIAYGGRA
jgi:hypothetical protein